jgi:hypothetical protein
VSYVGYRRLLVAIVLQAMIDADAGDDRAIEEVCHLLSDDVGEALRRLWRSPAQRRRLRRLLDHWPIDHG